MIKEGRILDQWMDAMDPALPTVAHVHTVVRTPNGNDYGKDLQRQHDQRHPHP